MRKVAAGLFSSIDGVVEAPNEWQPSFDDEMGAVLSRMLEEQDAVLLGRVTFTEWAGYWPNSTDEPFTSLITHGLLDELTLMISPVVAGGGRKRLFPADTVLTKFELVEGQPTSSGALIATYRPIR